MWLWSLYQRVSAQAADSYLQTVQISNLFSTLNSNTGNAWWIGKDNYSNIYCIKYQLILLLTLMLTYKNHTLKFMY